MPDIGSNYQFPAYRGARLGPFHYDGNLFVVAIDGTAMRVLRSTDGGATWASVQAALISGSNYLDVVQVGQFLYILYESSGGVARVGKFDVVTSSNISSTTTTNAPIPQSDLHTTPQTNAFLAVRADGHYVVGYTKASQRIMGTDYSRVWTRVYSSGTWGSEFEISVDTSNQAHYRLTGIVKDSASDRVHFFCQRSMSFFHWSLTAANGRGDTGSLVSTLLGQSYPAMAPVAYTDSAGVSSVAIGRKSTATGNPVWLAYAASADAPTWSGAQITAVLTESETSAIGALAVESVPNQTANVLHAMFVDQGTDDLWRISSTAPNSWGTAVEVADLVTVLGISANSYTYANNRVLAWVYRDNDTSQLVYNEHILSTTITSKSSSDTLTVSSPDTSSVVIGLSNSDTPTVSIAEATSISSEITKGDTPTVGLEESIDLTVAVERPDSLAAGISEVAEVSVLIDSTDVTVIGIADATSDITVEKSAGDSLNLSVSEAISTLSSQLSRIDSLAVGLTDTSAPIPLDTAARVSFPTPASALKTGAGLQEFRVLVRKHGAGETNPNAVVELYESGSFVSTLVSATSISSTTGTVLSGTWDATGRVAGSIECRVSSTNGYTNACLEVGAIEWNAVLDEEVVDNRRPWVGAADGRVWVGVGSRPRITGKLLV